MNYPLEEDIHRKLLKKKPIKLAVACSGGADSTALFFLLHRACSSLGLNIELAICHTNFKLRGEESLSEEFFLKDLAHKTKSTFFVSHPEKNKKVDQKIGVQAWARNMRYEFFSDLAKKGWTIALAHTKDDLFENIFMRLARGTSPIAAKGMSQSHGPYWRPLLDINKSDLILWLQQEKISWKEDSSNKGLDYTRNKFRHEIIPALEKLYPSAKKHFIRFAEQSQELAKFGQEQVLERLKTCLEKSDGTIAIPITFFTELESSLIHIALAHVISDLTSGHFIPESKILTNIEDLLRKTPEKSPQVQLTTNLFYRIKRGSFMIGENL